MTYGQLYKKAVECLGSAFEAGQLFTHVTNKQVIHLTSLRDKAAPPGAERLLHRLCERRKKGEPLQYLLGEWEFYGLPFRVGKGVLIPRQDTETLVDVALEKMQGISAPEVLDLCSGTGCVAIAFSHHFPTARVTALEVSRKAIRYLRENIDLNESAVRLVRADLHAYTHPRPLDMLLANPPYIPRDVIATLQKEVGYEPRRALDGGVDGLDFYRAIVQAYCRQVRPGGWICLEVGVGQSRKVRQIFAAEGLEQTGERGDYTGVPRVVWGRVAPDPQS